MTWPQTVAALWIAGRTVFWIFAAIRNREHTTAVVTIAIFVFLALSVAQIFVLSAGGFW